MLQFFKDQWLRITFFVACVVGLGIVWNLMSKPSLTAFENQLFQFLLFACSVAASWVFSKMYSEHGTSKSLRDYSVQVARGVMVLQSQIDDLMVWISDKRLAVNDELFDSRLEHVDQILRGFKAQTDATLRGVAGVMGDAFKQYQDTIKQINQTRVEATKEAADIQANVNGSSDKYLANDINLRLQELELRTSQKIETLLQKSTLPIPISQKVITIPCPNCKENQETLIGDGGGQTKSLKCSACTSRYNVHSSGAGKYFTRLIFASTQSEEIQLKNMTTQPLIPYVMVAIGQTYSREVFIALSHALIKHIAERKTTLADTSPKALIQKISQEVPEVSITLIRKFMQMLFWGKLFQFDGVASQNVPVVNIFTLDDVIVCFCRAAGRSLRLVVGHPIELTDAIEQISRYFAPALSGNNLVTTLVSEFSTSYRHTKRDSDGT
jgi:uncharacterized protein YukE